MQIPVLNRGRVPHFGRRVGKTRLPCCRLLAVFVVPSSVVATLLVMHFLGFSANAMSLGGVAISIGVVVDSPITMVETGHQHLDHEEGRIRAGQPPTPRIEIMTAAAKEVGPQLFFSLLILTVSFLPVFVLGGEAGRIFKPLAFTKTFAMSAAALLAITIIPVLMDYFITWRVLPKRWSFWKNPIITLGAMLLPAAALFIIASGMPHLADFRWWVGGGWAMLTAMPLLPEGDSLNRPMPIRVGSPLLYSRSDERISNTPGSACACGGVLVARVVLLPDRAGVSLFKQRH